MVLYCLLVAGQGRVLFKGQLFSAPMDWAELLTQLEKSRSEDALIPLPVPGAVLAARVAAVVWTPLRIR